MKPITFYIIKHYLKIFFMLLMGLSLLYAFIDYFQHSQSLSGGANLKILYIYYKWQESIALLYPLVMLFSIIIFKSHFIKHNYLVALHALGVGSRRILMPIIGVLGLLYLFFVSLETTSYAYASMQAKLILKHRYHSYKVNDLFFKYRDSFVFIKRLDPVKNQMRDVTLFEVKKQRVTAIYHIPKGDYKEGCWQIEKLALQTHHYRNQTLASYEKKELSNQRLLCGYKPKIVESFQEGKFVTLIDAFRLWRLLESQGVKSDEIRTLLYDKALVSSFAIAMVMVLFFMLPVHARITKIGIELTKATALTFVVWGLFFGLKRMASNAVFAPEYLLLLPLVLLWGYALVRLWRSD